MTPIPLNAVTVTPAVLSRWHVLCRETAERIAASGIRAAPGEEQMHVLDDGRLQISCDIAPGMSLVMHAERGEWLRVANN